MNSILIFLELLVLGFVSHWLMQSFYTLVILLTRTRSLAVTFVTLLLFPGTVVHELSHLFTAEILGVRTGKLTLAPESIRSEEIQAGSVAIAKTGPFRRAIIGLAPLFVGIASLCAIVYFITHNSFTSFEPRLIAMYYLIFSISNSMYPSAVDLRGVWQLSLVLFIFIIASSVAGIHLSLSQQLQMTLNSYLLSLVKYLGIVLAVNGVLLLIAQILITITAKITHRRIVSP